MARIAGVDIPNNKRVEIALTYINVMGSLGLISSKYMPIMASSSLFLILNVVSFLYYFGF